MYSFFSINPYSRGFHTLIFPTKNALYIIVPISSLKGLAEAQKRQEKIHNWIGNALIAVHNTFKLPSK